MNNKKFNIVCLGILMVLLVLLVVSVVKPFYKKEVISNKANDTFLLSAYNTEEISNQEEQTVDIKGNEVDSFMFYSLTDIKDIELWVTVTKEDKVIYHNVFHSVNKDYNLVYLTESVKKDDHVKIKFELTKALENVILKADSSKKFQIDQIIQKDSYSVTLWGIILVAIDLLVFFFKNIKKEKIDKDSKIKKISLFILYFILSLSFAFGSLYFGYRLNFHGGLDLLVLISLILMILGLTYCFVYLYKKNLSYEKVFLLIALPLTFFYCAFCMPEDSPDEFKHYTRIYQIASGDVSLKEEVEVPSNILADWKGHGNVKKLFTKMKEKTDYTQTKTIKKVAHYHPFCYFISVPIIFISKYLGLNAYVGWYLAKIFNAIFFLIMGYFIVKKMPKYKMLTILYLLMPMNLYQMGSVSCDVMATISTLYLIAHMLDIYVNKKIMHIKDFVIFTIFGFISMVSKIVYFPIAIGLIMINYKNIINKKSRWNILYAILSLLILSCLFLLWEKAKLPADIIVPSEGIIANSLSPIYAIKHPFSTIGVLLNYFVNLPDQYLLDFIGYRFIWSQVSVPITYAALYLGLMISACLIREDKENYSIFCRWLFVIVALMASSLVVLAMYALEYRSNMLANIVWGVQGRYFIPVFILFFMCIGKINYKGNMAKYNNTIISMVVFIHVLYIVQLIHFVIY